MTNRDVAQLLGLSSRRVTQGAKDLGVKKMGHQYWWEDSEVEALRKRIGKQGTRLKQGPSSAAHG